MRRIFSPLSWMFLAVAGVSGIFGRPEGVFLGIGAFVLTLIVGAIRVGRENRADNPLEQVSNDDRIRLNPLYKSKKEIDEIVAKHRDNAVVKVMGVEAQSDAEKILDQAVRLLNVRAELRRAKNAQVESDGTLERVRKSLEAATNPQEKEMLQSAIDAREAQQTQLDRAEEAMQSIDANLAQADAALSELKTRLLLAAAGSAEFDSDEMRDSISRLESLSNSFEEAEAIMKGTL